jgi:hypothetical protein
MNAWNEDNFLEKMMPQLRQVNRVRMGSCPDAELLTAFTENKVAAFVREAITAHLEQCRECSEICAQLVNFSDAGSPAIDPEWANAGKRLGNWMDGFLASQAAEKKRSTSVPTQDVPKVIFSWKSRWAVGVAVLALAVIAGVSAKRVWMTRSNVQIAKRQASPTDVMSVPDRAAQSDTTGPANAEQQMKPTAASPAGSAPELGVGAKESGNSPVASSETPDRIRKTGEPENQSRSSTRVPRPAEPVRDGNNEATNREVHTYGLPDLSPNDKIGAGTKPTVSPPASVMHAAASPHPQDLARGPEDSSPATIPPPIDRFRLEAGTRLWIRLNSPSPHEDGNFTFEGSLFRRVAQAGSTPLEQGTQLTGSGTIRNSKITVLVSRFVIQGVPYVLQGARGLSKQKTPGTGAAVEFDNGQVIEMWFSSLSVYGKAAEGRSVDHQ